MSKTESTISVEPLIIAGEQVTRDRTSLVRSPWSGEPVGAVPVGGAAETSAAVEAASRAMRNPLPAFERARVLERAAEAVREGREHLARLLVREIGKPLKYAHAEVDRCVETLSFSAVEARTLAGRGVALDAHPAGAARRGYTIRVPIGVVAAMCVVP